MDDLTDARVEDHFWWLCDCGTANEGYCGEDEFMCIDCGQSTHWDDLVTEVDWYQYIGFEDD